MKNTVNTMMNALNTMSRQADNYERFIQEKAGALQVTGKKEQAMFWSQALLAR